MLDIADHRSTKSDLGRLQHSITRIGDAYEVTAAFLLGLSLFYLPETDRKKRIARSGLTNFGGFCWLWCSVMVILMMVLKINGTSPDRLIAGSLITRFLMVLLQTHTCHKI